MGIYFWPIVGLGWMFVCMCMWFHNVYAAPWFSTDPSKIKLLILVCPLFDRWGQDWVISLAISIGACFMQGVAGLIIGTSFSVVVSLVLWVIRPYFRKKGKVMV